MPAELAERKAHGQPVAYIYGHIQDEHEQGEIEHGHQGLEELSGDMGSTKLPYRARPSADRAADPGAGVDDAVRRRVPSLSRATATAAISGKTMQPKRSNCNMDASLDLRG